MNPDDLAKILDELGKRLGPTGEHVFELAVRQVYINAATATLLLVVFVGINVLAVPRMWRYVTAPNQGSYSDRGMAAFLLGMLDVGVGGLVLLAAVIYIPSVLNPEYAAIRDILSAVSGTVR